jgi:hypothetical protein
MSFIINNSKWIDFDVNNKIEDFDLNKDEVEIILLRILKK